MSNDRRNKNPLAVAREQLFSSWHRPKHMERHITPQPGLSAEWLADSMQMIDLDCVEYCRFCKEPLALIETQRSAGPPKPATVTHNLGVAAGVPVFSLSYSAVPGQVWMDEDVESVRITQLHNPDGPPDRTVHQMTPTQFVDFLVDLRRKHPCGLHARKGAA